MNKEKDAGTHTADPFGDTECGHEVGAPLNESSGEAYHRVELSVAGLSCAGEAAPLANRLKRIPGVQEAFINPITERAIVRFDPYKAQVDAIVEVLTRRGLRTRNLIARLHAPFPEVDCKNCRRSIEEDLRQMPGVGAATVNADAGGVTVEFVPALTDAAVLRRRLLVGPAHSDWQRT